MCRAEMCVCLTLQLPTDVSSSCCRSCRQQVTQHLQPSPGAELQSSPAGSGLSPALPQHMNHRSEALLARVRQTAPVSMTGNAHGMALLTAEQLRQRMRSQIADLLLDDDDGG